MTDIPTLRRFDNHRFFAEYRSRFADNYATGFRDASARTPPVSGETVYDLLFAEGPKPDALAIREAFCHLVRQTPEAEAVLSRTWLTLLKDFTDYLVQAQKTVLDDAGDLSALIVDYSHLLLDIFFEVSREVHIVTPQLDRHSDAYQLLIERFNEYRHVQAPLIRINTYYRGIAVDSSGHPKSMTADSVTFEVHRYQAVALKQLGFALIDSPLHGEVFQAYPGDIDVAKRLVTFTHLVPHHGAMERRQYVRVEPRRPVEATIEHAGEQLNGRVVDLSIRAVSLYVRSHEPLSVHYGDTVHLHMDLPLDAQGHAVAIDAPGQVMRVFHRELGDPRAHRLVVTFPANVQLESELLHYINSRQSEILTELRELADRFAKG